MAIATEGNKLKGRTAQADTKPTPKVDVEALKRNTADEWARDIHAAYQSFLNSGGERVRMIVGIGNKLISMKADLNRHEWFHAFDGSKVETPIPFTTSYAERFMEIARNPVLSDADNCLRVPPTVSGLYALSRLDVEDEARDWLDRMKGMNLERTGPGTLARLMAEGRISAELTVRDIDRLAYEWADDDLGSTKVDAPRRSRQKNSPGEAERDSREMVRTLDEERRCLEEERESRRSEYLVSNARDAECRLCYDGHRGDQVSITEWVKAHVAERHAEDDVQVSYVITRAFLPMPEVERLTPEQRQEARRLLPGFAATWADKELPAWTSVIDGCRCAECGKTAQVTSEPEEAAALVERPAAEPDKMAEDTALAAFCRRAYGD